MTLEDIGEGDDALLCRTNSADCCQSPNIGSGSASGNWYFPNGTRVANHQFYRTRGNMTVLLNRRGGGEEGMYRCEIPDSTNVIQTIYIGVYTACAGE